MSNRQGRKKGSPRRHDRPLPQANMFSEQEVGAIIRRAVELTEEQGSAYQPGVTKEELRRIAEDVGVPLEALERAIREVGQVKDTRGPLQLSAEFERVVEGEVDPDQFDLIIEDVTPLQRGHMAGPTQIGRKLTMPAWNGVGQSTIEITAREGRTRIKVKSHALFQALMTLYPAFVGSAISMGALGDKGMIGVGVAIAAGLTAIGAGMFSFLTRRGHEKSRELADDLRDRVAQTLETRAAVSETQAQVEEPEHLQQRLGG